MTGNTLNFSFSDTIAGYVVDSDKATDTFRLKTSDERVYTAKLAANTYAELVRNLDEPYQDATGQMREMLTEGQHVFAYGIFYPDKAGANFEAMHLIFLGRAPEQYRFEAQDWWIKQIRSLGDYYLKAQFGGGPNDYRAYRTMVSDDGSRMNSTRQETDTISRLVYGFASAFLLTGDDRYLDAAEAGTNYLREHMRWIDEDHGIVYWYHALDVLTNGHERKILASQFGDDYDAIPAYEQIYALAGPVQTYRATGDPRILRDAEMTVEMFDRYFLDPEQGGYFSHIDPITFDPRAESLGQDRARKNWNSVGDHAPAYLINLYLATGAKRYADFLEYTFDTITEHFQDYASSPFVQEKFFEDWTHDEHWGWQQDRGVVGHNLKIAWNLTRMHGLKPKDAYREFAEKIATTMPHIGGDRQRHGWYDVMERRLHDGQDVHRYAWHDRKAWWQQEQGILAYLIMHGSLKKDEYLKHARESAAFYNAFFLDHDSGGVYFNVLANGLPFMMGTERLKGSHSMSGYHSFELCYLAAIYTNLLITKKPMDFYFRPKASSFPDRILRVAPDILPPGSIAIEDVWIDGDRWAKFDAAGLTVTLPESDHDLRVQVRIAPTEIVGAFDVILQPADGVAKLTLSGRLDAAAIPELRHALADVAALNPRKVAFVVEGASDVSDAAARALVFSLVKFDADTEIYVVGASDEVKTLLKQAEVAEDVTFLDHYDLTTILG